ncbi:hypothetical protein AVEN_104643-1 [Araneus ventricosus]|uniref:Uncharacterized protein n=1 Tax=Araneus ventricosus TaxID=182803 RepID=A0A4Y2BBK9_ARAVE|nr:hypothetical protein AVEN_104643-1 [Araneus ventricosus]
MYNCPPWHILFLCHGHHGPSTFLIWSPVYFTHHSNLLLSTVGFISSLSRNEAKDTRLSVAGYELEHIVQRLANSTECILKATSLHFLETVQEESRKEEKKRKGSRLCKNKEREISLKSRKLV